MDIMNSHTTYQMAQSRNAALGPAPAPTAHNFDAALDKAAREYESVFISQMLEHMFSGIEANEMFGGGEAEMTFRSLLLQEYGKTIADNGGVGLAQHLKRELLAVQEAATMGDMR
jgi:flagellar protein FlgJ